MWITVWLHNIIDCIFIFMLRNGSSPGNCYSQTNDMLLISCENVCRQLMFHSCHLVRWECRCQHRPSHLQHHHHRNMQQMTSFILHPSVMLLLLLLGGEQMRIVSYTALHTLYFTGHLPGIPVCRLFPWLGFLPLIILRKNRLSPN